MKNALLLIILWISAFSVQGQEPTQLIDLQTEAYLAFVNGKEAYDGGDMKAALSAYQKALANYKRIQQLDPSFKTDMLTHRVGECADQVKRIQAEIGSAAPGPGRPRSATQLPGPTRIGAPPPSQPRRVATAPSMIDAPDPSTNPELMKQSADLEYMEKYIELLRETKALKQRMVAVETREESSNLTIRELSKQLDGLTAEREDMLKTIEKSNARNSDLIEALDSAEKYEEDAARLRVALKAAEDNYTVLDAKLTTVENEFQSGKDSVRDSQQSMNQMKKELQQETDRANEMAVEIAKLKNEISKPDPELGKLRKTNRDLEREMKNLKHSQKTQVITLDAELETATNALAQAQTELEDLKSAAENAPDMAAMKEELEALNAEKESLVALVAEKTEALDALKDSELTIVELETSYATSTNEVEKLSAQVDTLKQQLEAAAESEGLAERMTMLTEENEVLKERVADMEGASAALEVELNARMEAQDETAAEAGKAVQRLKELQLNVEALKNSSALAGAKIDELNKENESLLRANVNLRQQMGDTEQSAVASLSAEQSKWDKEMARLKKTHDAALADQAKEITGLKVAVTSLTTKLDSTSEEAAAAKDALNQKLRDLEDMRRVAGSANSASDRLSKRITDLEEDNRELKERVSAQKNKADELSKSATATAKERDRIQGLADRLATAVKKASADHSAALANVASERDAAMQMIEQQKKALKDKDQALSDLQKQIKTAADKPMPARSPGLGDIVPLSALEQASGLLPFVHVRPDGDGGAVVEYPGIGAVSVK